jgi:hypothetical protein
MADLKLWVHVADEADDAPLADADVTGTFAALSDAEGNARNDVLSLTVTRDGYLPYVEQPYHAPASDTPIPIHLEAKPAPPAVHLEELTTRGHSFQLANGVLWTGVQCSDFNLLNLWQHGIDITPVLAQRQSCGFNLLRVWTAFDIPGIGTFRDIDYGRIPAFVALCASYGLRIEFTAYTGINDPQHWPRLCDAARQCQPRPLLELVNELDQNTDEPDDQGRVFHLSDYTKPDGLLASHGSNGSQAAPVMPHWDYAVMHFNDAFEWQRKCGHNAMEVWGGPTLSNENTRYPDKAQSPDLAYDAAAGAALLCAGSCFHSVHGKTSELWVGEELNAAYAWAAGALSVDLDYQDGLYNHVPSLETPDLLRVYQRYYNDPRGAFTVNIRKETRVARLRREAIAVRRALEVLLRDLAQTEAA